MTEIVERTRSIDREILRIARDQNVYISITAAEVAPAKGRDGDVHKRIFPKDAEQALAAFALDVHMLLVDWKISIECPAGAIVRVPIAMPITPSNDDFVSALAHSLSTASAAMVVARLAGH